jgi:hypothetical protein
MIVYLISMAPKRNPKWIDLFFEIVEKAYLGQPFRYGQDTFRLQPTLVRPADFHRRAFGSSLTSYESLLKTLESDFKTLARGEVYRVRTGWIAQGLKGYDGHKIRRITSDGDVFLVPDLARTPAIGIDTSGLGDNDTVIVVCSIPDFEGAYFFLEKHLNLPKGRNGNEFHWSRLKSDYRQDLLTRFRLLLPVCCDALLVMRTNALNDRRDKIDNLFKNLIDGCFSGYEKDPTQSGLRPALRKRFFQKMNNVATHCDADFRPLTQDKIVRLLVQTLARKNGERFETYTPLFANLRSHESKPIQIADIIAGLVKTLIKEDRPLTPIQPLPFDLRKMRKYSDRPPKAYFWFV